MSYQTLGVTLESIAVKLSKHTDKLGGVALSKSASALERAATLFDAKLDDAIAGLAPGMREFEESLNSPLARKYLKTAELVKLGRRIAGRSLQSKTPAQLKKDLLAAVRKTGNGLKASATLHDFLAQAAATSQPTQIDKAGLQKELLRLGALSAEELTSELKTRHRSVAALRKLAKANAIRFTADTSDDKLRRKIAHAAKRAYANISPPSPSRKTLR
jgi:hypothetical protein